MKKVKSKPPLWLAFCLLAWALFALPQNARAADPSPTPRPQAGEDGASLYASLCLPCHGEVGQGLTGEWKAQFGADQRCEDCHSAAGASAQFQFPAAVPPLAGQNSLRSFVTAAELQTYIQTAMPWWDPGFMTSQQAWALNVYLLQMRGNLPPGSNPGAQQASLLPIHLKADPSANGQTWGWAFAVFLGLALLLYAHHNRKSP